jgi:hypothetical protein
MGRIAFFILLLSSQVAWAEHDLTFAVAAPIFAPPLAYPRSPQTGFAGHFYDHQSSMGGMLGGRLPFLTYERNSLTLQMGIDGGGWFDLRTTGDAFPLVAADFMMGVPLMARFKQWSGSFEYIHISAHLGDGLEQPRHAITYSRETILAHVAYDFFWGRVYLTGGSILRTRPKHLNRGMAGFGFELQSPPLWRDHLEPYVAADFMWNQDTASFDSSGRAGVFLTRHDGKRPALSIALTGFVGKDRRGQFIHEDLKTLGFGFFFQY